MAKEVARTQGNILREVAVDVSSVDYESTEPFFIRSGAGDICYLPWLNDGDVSPAESVTKTVEAQVYFIDPVLCKKIYKTGTSATGIYVGFGI